MNDFDGGNDMDETTDAHTKSSGMFGPASNSLLSGPRVSINLKTAGSSRRRACASSGFTRT
jgi:hypothetical protein